MAAWGRLAGGLIATLALVACSSTATRSTSRAAVPTPVVDTAPAVPEQASRAHERAVRAMTRGDWGEAQAVLEALVGDYPQYAGPEVNLAIVYAQTDQVERARAALDRALAIDPLHAAANNQLGIMLREAGDFTAAEAAYRRALQRDPGYLLAHYNLGVLLDLYLRRPAEALDEYENYQDLLSEPDQTVARWILDIRRRLGADGSARVAQGEGS